MSIYRLSDALDLDLVGAKAANLGRLIGAGYPVPEGWVVATDTTDLLEVADELANLPSGLYAVRSSALGEDSAQLSFAGQYASVLNVPTKDLASAVRQCLDSADSTTVRAYAEHNHVSKTPIAVIIQKMVDPQYAGVVFTVNPVSGADTELLVEYGVGLAEDLVSGKTAPQMARYDWFTGEWLSPMGDLGENSTWLEELADTSVSIQELYGYPVDIEFAYAGGQIWFLQARPITRINQTALDDMWTTADFRDGGVSAEVCKPLMWSLYEMVWESALKDYLLASRLIAPRELRKLGRMFYARPYWNLSVVKLIMSRVPGYVERNFDTDYGIQPTYAGDGQVRPWTVGSVVALVPIALAQSRLLGRREASAQDLASEVRARIEARLADLEPAQASGRLEAEFFELIDQDYLFSETTYFWQIFLNTVHQNVFKDTIVKLVDDAAYLELLAGLEDISHLRPVVDLWRITRSGVKGEEAVSSHLEQFGYHSDRELDISYPNYWETPDQISRLVEEVAQWGPSQDPAVVLANQRRIYAARLEQLKAQLGRRKYRTIHKKIDKVRRLLWWREEFRDLSTRMYDVIRRYSLALASLWVEQAILADAEDFWFLSIDELREIRAARLEPAKVVGRNRRYYQGYRNYLSPGEIGPITPVRQVDGDLVGVGCSVGQAQGRARVIRDISEIDRIQPGDILVTRYTDTGWTTKFAQLAGVVTQYGGQLCHAALVAREYGIPCVVALAGVMDRVHDGDTLFVDGASGLVDIVRAPEDSDPQREQSQNTTPEGSESSEFDSEECG